MIYYSLLLLGPIENLHPGYLFLCPPAAFKMDEQYHFKIPDCTAHWSIDPWGVEWLTTEEAVSLGFPDMRFHFEVLTKSWNDEVHHEPHLLASEGNKR